MLLPDLFFFFLVLNFSILFYFFDDSCLLHSGKYDKRVSKQKENEDPERWDKNERMTRLWKPSAYNDGKGTRYDASHGEHNLKWKRIKEMEVGFQAVLKA